MSKESSLAVPQPSTAAIAEVNGTLEAMYARQMAEVGSEDAMERVISAILEADNIEEMLEGGKTQNADPDFLNIPLRVEGFRVVPSSLRGNAWFAVLRAIVLDTGEVIEPPLSSGSMPLLAQLVWLEAHNGFPFVGQIIRIDTAAKYRVYKFARVPGMEYEQA